MNRNVYMARKRVRMASKRVRKILMASDKILTETRNFKIKEYDDAIDKYSSGNFIGGCDE